ncbi:PREDICTED: NAC domain-containing protein 83-like [Nicotiana attenuata]|uniref:Nac domain-containing protein 83 n=1 Tax=Nicotiana attenuata TaxID=49451 RepID=A0A314LAJ8_NICAT|nr:PREDICTED: NAC domain-containing protein 83-like [Nicotiana attenuata]OIT37814.1 nac domain-containing protein 83 [Nicotiana attenuata]
MDKFNFVKDGAIKLPPGFRFQPTEEEIVFQYLIRKTFSCPLPASIIPEINICKHDPWDLPGDIEQDRYFFSNKEAKYRNGNRSNRATLGGYWKPTGLDKQITCSKRKPILGMKKTLVFYKGKSSHASRTDWIMHEYRLVLPKNQPFNFHHFKKSSQSSMVQIGNWVLCHIFMKKRNGKCDKKEYKADHQHVQIPKQTLYYDFMREDLSDRAISSCSSSLSNDDSSEVSSNPSGLVEHEEASNRAL